MEGEAEPEINLEEAWNSPEFQKFLREHEGGKYANKIDGSNPGFHVIQPVPAFCVKTKNDSEQKVFVNFCSHDKIPEPPKKADKETADEIHWRIPLSMSEMRRDLDAANRSCLVFDAVFNTNTITDANATPELKNFIIELAFVRIEEKSGDSLDRDFKILKMRSKGKPDIQQIRARDTPPADAEPQSEESTNVLSNGGIQVIDSETPEKSTLKQGFLNPKKKKKKKSVSFAPMEDDEDDGDDKRAAPTPGEETTTAHGATVDVGTCAPGEETSGATRKPSKRRKDDSVLDEPESDDDDGPRRLFKASPLLAVTRSVKRNDYLPGLQRPQYEVAERHQTKDFVLGETYPTEMCVRTYLPRTRNMTLMELDVETYHCIVHLPGLYYFKAELEWPIDSEKATARFNKKTHFLTVSMPVVQEGEASSAPSAPVEASAVVSSPAQIGLAGAGAKTADGSLERGTPPAHLQTKTPAEEPPGHGLQNHLIMELE
eukprot:Rmarinus@m.3579